MTTTNPVDVRHVSNAPGDPATLLNLARTGCVWFEMPGRTHIELGGADRAKFLHNFCTNDIKGLPTGNGCEAFITSIQGKILGHVFVYADPDVLTLASVSGCAEKLLRHLSRYQITEEVTFQDRTADWSSLFLVGPAAASVLSQLLGGPIPVLPEADLGNIVFAFEGSEVRIRRNDWLGLPGFEITVNTAATSDLVLRLRTFAPQAGNEVFEFLRISAGFPWYGVDLSDANLAQEAARTGQTISFRKGCYLGQEPIARIDAMGHVNQEVRTLRLETPLPPVPGTELFPLADPSKSAGRVTSSAAAPDGSGAVCLALVRRGHEGHGKRLLVGSGAEATAGVVLGIESA